MRMEADSKNDLWAFREGRQDAATCSRYRDLADVADRLCQHPRDTGLAISALMRAGEFESGLADANSGAQIPAQQLTDRLAAAFLGQSPELAAVPDLLSKIGRFDLPPAVSVSPPEGFAYYALHPHDFARLVERMPRQSASALVVGIRSIGTTLSAIVRAALKQQGKLTERLTVRPTGHPYDRAVHFTLEQKKEIDKWNAAGSDFLVVDEGPGRSGSSFLSVAEALMEAGVSSDRIILLGSRQADASQLCAANARERWRKFHFIWPEPSVYTRFSNHTYIGAGSWRDLLLNDRSSWPACWPQMERLKFLAPDRRFLFKFEGFGHFGEQVVLRAKILARAGFGCTADDAGDGMVCYPVIGGHSLHARELSAGLIGHLARYCAFRAAEFRVSDAPASQLPAMVGFNLSQEFGLDLPSAMENLITAEPVLTDGRMHPHEWIGGPNEDLIKTDACTHGDDHFFPGPCDIAWDLAGAIVEWNMDDDAADVFLSEFRKISGLNRAGVIRDFILAYTIFQVAYWGMAISTVTGSDEESRVLSTYQHYRRLAERQLRKLLAARQSTASSKITFPGDIHVRIPSW